MWKPANAEAVAEHTTAVRKRRPLTPPARGLLGLLVSRSSPGSAVPKTYGGAHDALVNYGDGLFGTVDP